LPSYLGDYTAHTVIDHAWRGIPFLCHTKVNYESRAAVERTQHEGKLCRGGLIFANRLNAPQSADPSVNTARAAVEGDTTAEVMSPAEFKDHHDPANVGANMAKLAKSRPKARKVKLPAAKVRADKLAAKVKGKPSEEQIEAEIAALESLRDLIVPESMFGDDNLDRLETAITVLRERYDESDIDDRYEPLDEDDDVEGDDNACVNADEGRTSDKAAGAREVAQWIAGDSDQRPSDGWPLKDQP
jgi:hypothetical protein